MFFVYWFVCQTNNAKNTQRISMKLGTGWDMGQEKHHLHLGRDLDKGEQIQDFFYIAREGRHFHRFPWEGS